MMTLRRLLVAAAGSALLCVKAATAGDIKAGPLTIEAPWARSLAGTVKNSAAYMTITNSGDAADKLMAVKSNVAEHVMLHESRMEGDVMKMIHVEGGIEVPAHGSAELKPLGLHVMLTGVTRPLADGDTFPMTLVFAKQGDVAIEVSVRKTPASAAHDHP